MNAALLILETETGNVKAYVGNTSCSNGSPECWVDIIDSPRSTGSIMKPYLYAAMLDAGILLPSMLIPDVPTHISGYTPKNLIRPLMELFGQITHWPDH